METALQGRMNILSRYMKTEFEAVTLRPFILLSFNGFMNSKSGRQKYPHFKWKHIGHQHNRTQHFYSQDLLRKIAVYPIIIPVFATKFNFIHIY